MSKRTIAHVDEGDNGEEFGRQVAEMTLGKEVAEMAKEMLDEGYDEGETEWMRTTLLTSDAESVNVKSALISAIKMGNFTFAQKITKHPSYNLTYFPQPLRIIVSIGSEECIETFLSDPFYSKDINVRLSAPFSGSVLTIAAQRNPKLVLMLLRRGADLTSDLNRRLLTQVSRTKCQPNKDEDPNFVQIVQQLFDAGLTIRTEASPWRSPLSHLVRHLSHRLDPHVARGTDRVLPGDVSQHQQSNSTQSPNSSLSSIVIQNGRLLLNVYGSDIRECVDLLAAKSPCEELQFGLCQAMHQMLFVIKVLVFRETEINSYSKYIAPALNCLHDLVSCMLHYYSCFDDIQPENVNLCDKFFKSLSSAHKGNLNVSIMSIDVDLSVPEVYLGPVLAILKELVRFKSIRRLENFDNLSWLILHDCGRYLPFVNALNFHQTDKDGRELWAKLRQKCEVFIDEFPPDTIIKIKLVLDGKLTTPLSLKHAAAKCIVQSLGGTVRRETIHTLPLPLALRNFVLG